MSEETLRRPFGGRLIPRPFCARFPETNCPPARGHTGEELVDWVALGRADASSAADPLVRLLLGEATNLYPSKKNQPRNPLNGKRLGTSYLKAQRARLRAAGQRRNPLIPWGGVLDTKPFCVCSLNGAGLGTPGFRFENALVAVLHALFDDRPDFGVAAFPFGDGAVA